MWRKKEQQMVERPRIGVALSGGAARGIAHLGVLKVLEEQNVPIDFIAGTSAGALVGGAVAAGIPLAELEEWGRSLRWRDIGRMTLSRLGVQSNARLEELIRARFPVTRFEDLRIPFAAVATDLHTGKAVVMSNEGDVAFAIRASCALPGWYVPVVDEQGRQLVDGGLAANVPSAAARSLGADIVIAVDVNAEGARFLGPPQSAIGVLFQSIMVVQRTAAAHQWQDADLVIRPRVGHIRWDEIGRADELIKAGEEATRITIDRIKHLLFPTAEGPPPRWFELRRRGAQPPAHNPRKMSPLR
ncbi:MAG: patatin-like phospholipase family protein [Pyrinomonadaceae bacterium]|nr:patatin-like phospholipase family protein [Pyrinomonadaceae bacterium]